MTELSQPQPSFGDRRGHRPAPLQTNFSRPSTSDLPKSQSSRLNRPRPTEYHTVGSEEPVPLTPVKRQSSKSSLRSLFGRDKNSRVATQPDTKLTEIEEAQQPTPQTAIRSDTPLSPPDCATPRRITSPTGESQRPSRNKLKSPRRANFENIPRPKEHTPKPKAASREQYGWKPPPLFQSYPQSIKHEALSAPALSADSILRLQAANGKASADDGQNGMRQDGASAAARKKKEQKEKKHMRTVSGTINKVEWTKKIYVLATAGYILQYAGDGKHDRLPEKMLQLGAQSVAFASDAIPGKHWVVQISQNPASDAAPEPAKPRFVRFGFNRSHARRMARSFLLVFDNPDAMISWLMAIRAEIEARGGPKLTTEKHTEDDSVPQLRSKSSVRQMVKKDPHRISSLFLQPQNLRSEEEEDGKSIGGLTWPSRRSSYGSLTHRSMIGSRSESASTTGPTEGAALTNDSGYAFASSDTRTSSFTSAPPGSPSITNSSFVLETPLAEEVNLPAARSPPSSSHGKRDTIIASPQTQPSPITNGAESPQAVQLPSTVPEVITRSTSPPAPNFSVPSFSKKFVSRVGRSPNSQLSPPSSAASLAHRGETATDPSASTLFSPPLSPTYSVASSRHTDSTEPPPLVSSGGAGRRTVRVSNSEDALTRVVRASQTGPNNVPRAPRTAAPGSPESNSFPHRPPSMAIRPEMDPQIHSEPHVQIPPPTESAPRTRVSVLYPENQMMSRRKSMPGLSIGPPSAPPPTCPLPKLPSPLAAQEPPPWSSGAPANRFYLSSGVREHVERRKSGIMTGSPSSSGKTSKEASPSKLVNGMDE